MSEAARAADDPLVLAGRLYAALAAPDVVTLRGLLTDDFHGEMTPGLPWQLGDAPFRGADAMVRDCWGLVARHVEVAPQVDRLHVVDGWIVARGRYVGRARATGRPLDAWFAHFWQVEGARVARLRQVTDSAAWWAAAGDPRTGPA